MPLVCPSMTTFNALLPFTVPIYITKILYRAIAKEIFMMLSDSHISSVPHAMSQSNSVVCFLFYLI